MNRYICQIFILILCSVYLSECGGSSRSFNSSRSSYGRSGRGTGAYYGGYTNGNIPPSKSQSKLTQSNTSRGIGAWGYVAIILTVILSGLGVYYFILLYPIFCKKERMYDVMEMTTV